MHKLYIYIYIYIYIFILIFPCDLLNLLLKKYISKNKTYFIFILFRFNFIHLLRNNLF